MKVNGNMNRFYYYSFPMQAVLVTCNDKDEKTNVITIAWHTPISKKPALYGISVAPGRYSHDLIQETKEFVVNFIPYNLVEKVNFCGTHSGRKIDKIAKTGLSLEQSQKIKTPFIKEGYAHLECRVYKSMKSGDHTLFIGEVVNVLIDEDAFVDDILDNEKTQPTQYIGGNIYTTVSRKKKSF